MFVRVAPPYGFAIALALLAGAVIVVRAVLNPLLGTQFASAPVFVAALVVTWYLGTAPAIMIALLGYPAVKFFVRHEPFGADLSDDLSGWLMYLVLIALVIGFTRRFRIDHEELVIVSRERQRSEQRLYHQANFDALTGIANRMLFFDHLNMTLEHVTRHGSTLAILFIDIDNFKDVNDTYGHVAGDQLLTQIAGALKESVRAEDTVARLGGDEFAVLVPRLGQEPRCDAPRIKGPQSDRAALPGRRRSGCSLGERRRGALQRLRERQRQTGQMRRHGDVSGQEARQERLSRL